MNYLSVSCNYLNDSISNGSGGKGFCGLLQLGDGFATGVEHPKGAAEPLLGGI
jgi:hypothetical protein